jgi:TetR/AcrR family transcriptional regulator, transcriptional repressor for nem operon
MSKGEATRQRIIAQAAPLFNLHGYEGCSLQDVMAVTGLEKGGIYRHFDNKEELAAEAFDFAWATTLSKRFDNLAAIPNHVDRLKQHILNFTVRSGLPGGCPLLNTAVDSDNGNPVLRERVRKALRGWQNSLKKILHEGIAAGTIQPDIDINKTASLIIGTLEGGMLISRIEKSDQALRNALDHLDNYLETKIRKPTPRRSKKL